ncbi:MAG: hypothetical protein P1P69_01430 [Methanosarcinaceae archaeon]|nr:hypothetical protein [Methanosarcinaceae archaeon]MDF1533149.1 hypothetical protein [Methanosarcinaceae archaeon]
MEILAALASLMVFGMFVLTVLIILIDMSSIMAMLILLFVPILAVLIMPKSVMAFLSYQHLLLADGLVPINNFHILLLIWSTLIGIILYTEFLTWYLARKAVHGHHSMSLLGEVLNLIQSMIDSVTSKVKR